MFRSPWPVVLALGTLQVGLSWLAWSQAQGSGVTYVFTPLVDVVPGGAPLSAGEAADLAADAKNTVDARDIQRAYARLGSTISLDDLLRGVETLDDLDPGQRERVAAVLADAQAKHREVWQVQEEILRLEARLDGQVTEILDTLPADTRAQVTARRRP